MADSNGFAQLDSRIQRWIWDAGWTTLRDIQERAIPAVLPADHDVILAAATAAGKTEAAFFPILSRMVEHAPQGCVLYISPLKALINNQMDRLQDLCQSLELPVVGWHGDIQAGRKTKFLKRPTGVLLITPESLEALFVRQPTALNRLAANLQYVVIDELHAFIGSERGKQLQSLLHRLERVAERPVPRVGLSATLGDMQLAAQFLRPANASNVEVIVAGGKAQELKMQVRGYVAVEGDSPDPAQSLVVESVAGHLYKTLRGSNNLVFPNSRREVETYAGLLRVLCEQDGVLNEFVAHHGSLSKYLREDVEQALRSEERPTTAICTTTLELGIDIGPVKSIAQIGAPPSVASLRQRLGRSGRREGEPAILRAYCVEPELTGKSPLGDCLREGLVQAVAMIRLLLAGWFEPPRVGGLHYSTLVQQLLSVIAERNGATPLALWNLLVKNGPFQEVSPTDFKALLRHLGASQLLTQDSSGLLLHGKVGEPLVNHYEFFAAFATDKEFRLVCGGKSLGTLPVDKPLKVGQRIGFAGRRWEIQDIDMTHLVIVVVPGAGGVPPHFGGESAMVHTRVREEMRCVLSEQEPLSYLDGQAQRLLKEARQNYQSYGLDQRTYYRRDTDLVLLPWSGDWCHNALVLLLEWRGLRATNDGLSVTVKCEDDQFISAIAAIRGLAELSPEELLANAVNLQREKWDWALPADLLAKSYASLHLDFEAARDWLLALNFQPTTRW